VIGAQERATIAAAIADVERRTDAELVTVLAACSDDYHVYGLLWAAVAALLLAPLLLLFELSAVALVAIELGTFCALVVLFASTRLGIALVPATVRAARARDLARRQFLEQGLHHTGRETGVLIFVSEAEHYVEILADRGIADHVEADRWPAIVDQFVADVRAGRVSQGFLSAIAACGEILAEVCPKTPDNRNELDDRLILIGYDD
jgi:putative membrane protein